MLAEDSQSYRFSHLLCWCACDEGWNERFGSWSKDKRLKLTHSVDACRFQDLFLGLFVFIWQFGVKNSQRQQGKHTGCRPDSHSGWNQTLRLAQMKDELPRAVLLNCFILALCYSPHIQKVFACHLFHILPLPPYSTSQSYTQHPIMIKCKRLLGGWVVNPEFCWVWEGLCYLLVNSVLYFSAFEFCYYSDPWFCFLILSFVYFIVVIDGLTAHLCISSRCS